jgi:peptide/nickel transport system substrate-binding protein
VDDLTVRLVLKHPYGPLLSTMASNYGPMVFISPTAFRMAGEAYGKAPVGTGPFKFESWTEGKEVVLAANPDYWGGRPRLDRVVFKVVPEATERLNRLLDGSLHVITDFEPKFVERVFPDPPVEFTPIPRPRVEYLGFSTTVPPYTDRRVRQAIAHAINVERTVLFLSRGTAIPAHGPLPPGLWGYNPQARQPGYDPKRARELLAEAGYPQASRTRLLAYAFIPGRLEYADVIRSDSRRSAWTSSLSR